MLTPERCRPLKFRYFKTKMADATIFKLQAFSNVLSNAIFRTVVHQLTLRVAGPSATYELLAVITARVC